MRNSTTIFLTLCPFLLFAQYESVIQGQLALFNNGWDVRGIEIESVSAGSGGQVLYSNYPTVEFDDQHNAFIGNSWLGPEVISHGGWNHFVNVDGDTIHIYTNASIGQAWEFYRYDANKYVQASVDTIIQSQFIGLTDSVKVIRFETIDNGIASPEWIDELQIRISKSHGLVEAINFYEFPEPYSNALVGFQLTTHYDDLIDYATTDTTYTLHGLIAAGQTSGTGIMTPSEIYDIPVGLRFAQEHSVYEYYNGGEGGWWKTTFDHYVAHHDLTDSTSNVDAHTCYYNDWEVYTSTGTEYNQSEGTIDTMSVIGDLNLVWYGDRPYELTDQGGTFRASIRHINVDDRRVLSVMENLVNTGGDSLNFDGVWRKFAYLEGIGQIYDYHKTSSGSGLSYTTENDIWRLVFYRTWNQEWDYQGYEFHDSCMAQYVPIVVGLEDDQAKTGRIYPNPSNGVLNFTGPFTSALRVVDMNGRTVYAGTAKSGKLILDLKAGIYTVLSEELQERIVITD